MTLRRRYYPHSDGGEVHDFLAALRRSPRTRKAAAKLDIDLQTLESFWPETMNVTVRLLRGWEPLRELKREYDGVAYRVFFTVLGDEMWLLSAFEKKSAETPRREIEKAYRRMKLVREGRR